MTKKLNGILLLLFFIVATNSISQEVAPLKTFEYKIGLNKLKTQDQADLIRTEVSKISGVKNCELILINYELTFTCTNHDMTRYQVMDNIKRAIVKNGSEVVNIERTLRDEK